MKDVQFELGGQVRTLRFDLGTLRDVGAFNKTEPLDGVDTVDGYRQVLSIVYCGACRVFKRAKQEVPITVDNAKDWVDDLSTAESLAIVQAFNRAYATNADTPGDGEDDADKKK